MEVLGLASTMSTLPTKPDEHQKIASNCDAGPSLPPVHCVYDSPVPATFLRSATSITAHTKSPTPPFFPRAIHTYKECQIIVLTSEIGHGGATGVVLLRGTLQP